MELTRCPASTRLVGWDDVFSDEYARRKYPLHGICFTWGVERGYLHQNMTDRHLLWNHGKGAHVQWSRRRNWICSSPWYE